MLDKAYDPKACEDRIYKMWEDEGAFTADAKSKKEPFTISMPPPNATGQLHLGHAVMLAIQDIFIRFARMQGKEALWVPGTDHAALAVNALIEKQLAKEKTNKHKIGREEFLRRTKEFVETSKGTIRGQVRKMGSSCDWSRERYTFDPALNRLVNEVFARMKNDGLIYRGHRIVNWDPKLQTTVSDDEVVYVEEKSPFYTFQYGPFQIGTSRPETKFGDKYVVMHPDDERYTKYKHGETFECEWINGPVRATIIKDAAVDPAFGTGVMTITPWHDHIDFDMAERHGLDKEQVIGFDGKLLAIAGEFEGMKIEDARPKIVEKLESKGLLVKVDNEYVHNKATAQRGGGSIEPQIKLQWFIDVNKPAVQWKKQTMSLKEVMHDVVHHGDVKIIPDRFDKTYFYWIDNLRDWCISRQIWWGHRVPVYYCSKCKNPDGTPLELTYMGNEPLTKHEACGSAVEQDPDTLDTWFSSALWTWSTLVDPALTDDFSLSLQDLLKKSPDFQKFHPTSVMETGYDILFFWVARMILMTTYAVGQIPFHTVYLHGLIRTRDGRKMSKSDPETMIDPLDQIAKYGADALRLSMIVGQSPGADSRLYEEKIAGYRNFVNKLWNASRFILLQCEEQKIDPKTITSLPKRSELSLADRALLHALDVVLTEDVTKALAEYRLSEVGERLYSFLWDYFCDWYLELSKGEANLAVLVHALRKILKLLHPFTPFVTEELWSHVKPADAGMLIKESWPVAKKEHADPEAFAELQRLIDITTAIRKLRADQDVTPGKQITVFVVTKDADSLSTQAHHIVRLGKLEKLEIFKDAKGWKNIASVFLDGVEVHLSLEGLIDTEKERANLTKEKAELEKFTSSLAAKLKNKEFVDKAPEKVVTLEREKLAVAEEKLAKVSEKLEKLK